MHSSLSRCPAMQSVLNGVVMIIVRSPSGCRVGRCGNLRQQRDPSTSTSTSYLTPSHPFSLFPPLFDPRAVIFYGSNLPEYLVARLYFLQSPTMACSPKKIICPKDTNPSARVVMNWFHIPHLTRGPWNQLESHWHSPCSFPEINYEYWVRKRD